MPTPLPGMCIGIGPPGIPIAPAPMPSPKAAGGAPAPKPASPGASDVMLAGGLSGENVAEAIRVLRPYGVDASSALESSPGRKDPELVRRYIEAVRVCDASLEEAR